MNKNEEIEWVCNAATTIMKRNIEWVFLANESNIEEYFHFKVPWLSQEQIPVLCGSSIVQISQESMQVLGESQWPMQVLDHLTTNAGILPLFQGPM